MQHNSIHLLNYEYLTKYFPQDTVLSVHPEPGAILQTKVVIVIQNNLQLQSESPAASGGHSKIFL